MELRAPDGKHLKGSNKGVTFTDAHRAALSKAWEGRRADRKGTSHYRWKGGLPECKDCGLQLAKYGAKHCRDCYAKYLTGENSPKWQGGKSTQNHLERTKFGLQVRPKVFERDQYRCTKCGAKGDLHVDHIKPWAEYPELRFDMDNCRTLCVPCHYERTFGREHSKTSTWGLINKQVEVTS